MLDRVGHLGLKALVGLRMLELSVVLGQGAGLDRGLGVCNTLTWGFVILVRFRVTLHDCMGYIEET